MNDNAQQLLDSLLSYHFVPAPDKQWSHVGLFKEYARRMAWWADYLGAVNNWLTSNLAYVLELDDGLERSPLQQLDAHLQAQTLYQPMPALLRAALMFAMVADHEMITRVNLANPYDALIKLYTRGGYMCWNPRGFWEISGAFGVSNMNIPTYKTSAPFIALDDEELDLIDKGDKQNHISNCYP